MKKLLFSGLLVTVPLGLTFYVVYFIYHSLSSISAWVPLPVFPGSAIIYIFLFILLVGLVSQWWIARQGIALIEYVITRFPGIKTLYQMTKESVSSLAGEKRAFSQVVLYRETDEVYRIGFLTSENVGQFELPGDYVCVYFPNGLQIAGEIRLLPRSSLEFVQTPVEETLQFCLSAGVAAKKEMEKIKKAPRTKGGEAKTLSQPKRRKV